MSSVIQPDGARIQRESFRLSTSFCSCSSLACTHATLYLILITRSYGIHKILSWTLRNLHLQKTAKTWLSDMSTAALRLERWQRLLTENMGPALALLGKVEGGCPHCHHAAEVRVQELVVLELPAREV